MADEVEFDLQYEEPNIKVITVVWDVDADKFRCNWTGLNRMEAIGLLTTALDAVHNVDVYDGSEIDEED